MSYNSRTRQPSKKMIVTRTDYGIMHANDGRRYSSRFQSVDYTKGYVLEEYNVDGRRRFHRFHRAQPVRFQLKDPSRFGGSLSCDLSEGGIRVHLSEFIPLNTELTVSIQLSDESIMECPCRVAWVEKNRCGERYQVGLEFVEADSILDSQRKIHGFLSRQE